MNDRILYIGIAGKKCHGKDTFAGFVKDELLPAPRCVSTLKRGFADALREEVAVFLCRELTGVPKWSRDPCRRIQQIMRTLTSDRPEEKEPFRLLMQWWGVEFRRSLFGEDYWIKELERFATSWLAIVPPQEKLVLLVPDVRLPNEVDFIRSQGGILVKVNRRNMVDTDSHSTETALDQFDGWDVQVKNDGTLDDLQNKAAAFVRNWLEPLF